MARPDGRTVTGSLLGQVSDINIWERVFDSQDVKNFHECNAEENDTKKILDWDKSIPKLFGLKLEEINKEDFCPKRTDKITIGFRELQLNFNEVLNFCENVFDGRIAVAYDEDYVAAIMKEKIFLNTTMGNFNGFVKSNETDLFVDFYDKIPMPNFTWQYGQPNNFEGNQNCTVLLGNEIRNFKQFF